MFNWFFFLIFLIDFRADWINRVGKKIRFRRKKKEKIKTENRARKALKTISLILGKGNRKKSSSTNGQAIKALPPPPWA